ncbi:hypothetical protein PY78_14205 [Lacticaseibacillus rhamnosus]|nr:hypothetical protein PY78_14205 [Lacticaseibacillus rhamnosus]
MGFLFCFHSTIYEANFTPKPRHVKALNEKQKNELILLYQDKRKVTKNVTFKTPKKRFILNLFFKPKIQLTFMNKFPIQI